MAFLFVALILGFILARYKKPAQTWTNSMEKLGSLALVILLFSMGLSLGANPDLVMALPNMGLKALILSLGSIFGSVLFLLFGVKARGQNNDR